MKSEKAKVKSEKKNIRSAKALAHRQILINQAIDLGAFDNREHFKMWMKKEFGLEQPVSKISTEHTLTDNQMRLMYRWLLYFTGRGPKPEIRTASRRVSKKQLWRINQLQQALGWEPSRLADFIQHQLGDRKLPGSLFKDEATKLITGMDRILAEAPFKPKS